MTALTHLDEYDFPFEVIYHRLVALSVPPFDSVIVFTSGDYNPEWQIFSEEFLYLGWLCFLFAGEVDITFEGGRRNRHSQFITKKLLKAVNEMMGGLIASVNERVLALDFFDPGMAFFQWGNVRIVIPERGSSGSYVSEEFARVAGMKVAQGCSKHDDVTGG